MLLLGTFLYKLIFFLWNIHASACDTLLDIHDAFSQVATNVHEYTPRISECNKECIVSHRAYYFFRGI